MESTVGALLAMTNDSPTIGANRPCCTDPIAPTDGNAVNTSTSSGLPKYMTSRSVSISPRRSSLSP